ncbi:hypothetical protein HAX54_039228 [Datura stramonium]|uniref:Uncharacterized protein n=1 Tax=Datura stramonium TaxID=4076 RepID=A0ABS8VLN5_DATST|nr:hypothetical protein [Datura stramonium]
MDSSNCYSCVSDDTDGLLCPNWNPDLGDSDSSHAQQFPVDSAFVSTSQSSHSSLFRIYLVMGESIMQFKKGVEEASVPPTGNSLLLDVRYNVVVKEDYENGKDGKVDNRGKHGSPEGSRRKKNIHHDDFDVMEERSSKQSAVFSESTTVSSKHAPENVLPKGSNGRKPRGKKQGVKEMRDLRTILTLCAQAVAADDRRTANEFGSRLGRILLRREMGCRGWPIISPMVLRHGWLWPCLQRLSCRPGGPPKLRITGIDFPNPGFRPAERVEETGRRLADYAESFNVPFEFIAIAQKNLLDETVVVNSPRDIVLNLIRKLNPDVYIQGIVNGAYNAPYHTTRRRFFITPQCLICLKLIFPVKFLRDCWAGFRQPLNEEILTMAKDRVKAYHKDFVIDEQVHPQKAWPLPLNSELVYGAGSSEGQRSKFAPLHGLDCRVKCNWFNIKDYVVNLFASAMRLREQNLERAALPSPTHNSWCSLSM